MTLQAYDGHCKVRFPFDTKVYTAMITAYDDGDIRLHLDNGKVEKLNSAQFLRYLVKGHIWNVQ